MAGNGKRFQFRPNRGARLFPHVERVSLQPPQRFCVLRLRAAPTLQDQDLVVVAEREGVQNRNTSLPKIPSNSWPSWVSGDRKLHDNIFESRNSAAPTVNDLTCTTFQRSSVCVAEMVIVPVRICWTTWSETRSELMMVNPPESTMNVIGLWLMETQILGTAKEE